MNAFFILRVHPHTLSKKARIDLKIRFGQIDRLIPWCVSLGKSIISKTNKHFSFRTIAFPLAWLFYLWCFILEMPQRSDLHSHTFSMFKPSRNNLTSQEIGIAAFPLPSLPFQKNFSSSPTFPYQRILLPLLLPKSSQIIPPSSVTLRAFPIQRSKFCGS